MDTQSALEQRTVEEDWPAILTLLPPDLEVTAMEARAITRRREIKTASVLLRLAMAYSLCCRSLQETVAWAAGAGVARLSRVGLLKRLKKGAPWLGILLTQKLAERTSLCRSRWEGLRLRLIDATCVSRPGSKGTDWRIHLGFDLSSLQIDHIDLTGVQDGETLTRIPLGEGDIAVCDRAYGTRKGIWSVVCAKAHLIVRLCWSNIPLLGSDGCEFKILSNLRKLPIGEIGDFAVTTKPSKEDRIPAIAGRVVAIRKSRESTEGARRRLHKEAKRKGKTPSRESLEACEYVFLFTTLPVELISAEQILEIYRFRWQVELTFKRMKGILYLDEMAAKDDQLCRAFLFTKLLAALLVDDLSRRYGAFSPWGYGCPSSTLPLEGLATAC